MTKLYKPAIPVVASKAVLVFLKRALPRQAFGMIYDLAVSSYRVSVRFLYLRFWLYAILSQNSAVRRKVITIFKVMPYSLVGWRGLEATYDAVLDAQQRHVPGTIVECGVAQGGSAALMALVEARDGGHRKLWLFDSYEGLPEPTKQDFQGGTTGRHLRPLPKGACLGTYEQVKELLFQRLRLNQDNITLAKGWFQDSLPVSRNKVSQISVLRIDADWYESVKCCLENLYDQVAPGGNVIVDDYSSCFGAQCALDEFLAKRKITVVLHHDGRGGCLFMKPLG